MSNSQVEWKTSNPDEENTNSENGPDHSLKLDPHGFPLRPQPSDDPLGL